MHFVQLRDGILLSSILFHCYLQINRDISTYEYSEYVILRLFLFTKEMKKKEEYPSVEQKILSCRHICRVVFFLFSLRSNRVQI